ncbi:hypothetical protein ACFVWR_16020 [Leifsonia sp. NPDC058292]|uniref:hypothetical protein n=1 Tax=Leifsonia sp. NPDC058292 TaxID=3346428 RepID=UPI0036DE1708
MIDSLQAFVAGQPEILKWLAIALVSAIPFVEVYLGTTIGIVAGVHPVVAASAAIVGNAAAVLGVIFVADWVRGRVRGRVRPSEPSPVTPRRARLTKLFNRFGVPGVSLLGHPTQISSAALIAFGARLRTVILWQLISIVLWGALVAALVGLGVQVISH